MRRLLTFLALLTVSAACSDTPTDTKLRPGDVRGPLLQLSLEDYIQQQIDALLPKGFEASVDARWSTVLEKEAAGDIEGAKKHLFTLTDWITKKTGEITPPDGETQAHAAARLNFAMFERIFGGPGAQVPEVAPNSDIVFAIVPAGEAATITTPAVQAGLSFDAGATGETRAFVITQDPKRYEGQCEGPLPTDDDPAFPKQRTRLCQYPLFYIFNSYPDLPLNTPGRIAVCMVTSLDDSRRPLDYPGMEEVHERLRLAHNDPGEANRVEGSIIEDGLEILPKVADSEQSGLLGETCEGDITYAAAAPARGGWLGRLERGLFAAANFAGRLLTPKNLYAYDRGPEFDFRDFSNFNAVDPFSRPDLAAADYSVSAAAVTAGGTVDLSFAVTNASRPNGGHSTARSEPVYADIVLSSLPGAPAFEHRFERIEIPALRPDERFPTAAAVTRTVTIPLSAEVINTPTTYNLSVIVSPNPGLSEEMPGNNIASRAIRVDPRPADVSVASGPTVTAAGTLFPGSQITVGWTSTNSGFTNAGAAMLRRFTLSTDQVLGNGDDISLGDQVHGGVAAQTTTGPLTSIQTLPATLLPGAYYLYLTLDPTGVVPESNEENNSARSAVAFTVDPAFAFKFGFEDNEEAWVGPTGGAPTGFWHRSTLRINNAPINNSVFGPLPAPFAGTHALWYGRDATGNFLGITGGANSGIVRSPSFTMPTAPTGGQVRLELQTWWEIEGASPTVFDIMSVELEVTTVTGATQNRVLRRLNPTVGAGGATYSSGGANQPPVWVAVSIPVPLDIQGRPVRIRFSFNTGDGLFNNMRGWVIDDVAVRVISGSLLARSSGTPLFSTTGSDEELVPADQIVFPVRTEEP